MGQILNVSNAITMAIVIVVADIKWNYVCTTLNASSVITMGTWLKIIGIRRFRIGDKYMKTK